ncbi:pyridoxamine 5'-phosphate oxidase [Segetibacter sp.]|jgi:pyridoxamine 5'-phosphate oxidase|uniref:pyridoxamine 5'-phosphate oxidase n=1 Tax=Segetibacter sp. TaxID=2231182 RepID=UPI0026062695|nr:pyridoxamine 5'-phosphate oxidase [Segetibacter sp.]MCW3082068.1 pyridoxamine 6-phosphate oxidase [Segetibacter sp.]
MHQSIADIRKDYKLRSLSEEDVSSDPIEQFTNWWSEAVNSKIDEVNAMTLATATPDGIPSARIVLLKGLSKDGFLFFTNYNSQKGKELAANAKGALVFFWKELERQVRIEGTVEKVSEADSAAYFASRPAASKIGAWASDQSTIVSSRKIIEESFLKYQDRFGEGNIPKPTHWGGYIVKPVRVEFWQGRRSRLHDRILYSQISEKWNVERLAP